MTSLMAKKLGCTSYHDDNGDVFLVTLLEVENMEICSNRTSANNGYDAAIVAYGQVKESRLTKPQLGFYKKLGIEPKKHLKEFRGPSYLDAPIGKLEVVLNEGEYVDATSTSKGKGFAGVMKRHNFSGLRASHGVSIAHRSAGSTGQNQDPGKVFKGKKMAGQMGNKQVTIQNLKVVSYDKVSNILLVKGSVPGCKGTSVFIRSAVKNS